MRRNGSAYTLAAFALLLLLTIPGCHRENTTKTATVANQPSNGSSRKFTVAVWADGRLSVNGKPSDIESLREALARWERQNGPVLLYRESGTQVSTPTATEVAKALGDFGLPDRVSRTPDFADGPKSVQQTLEDLHWFMEGETQKPTPEAMQKEANDDLAEIKSLGLVDRAQKDFAAHYPNAKIENMSIGYFRDTNVVWCDLSFKIPGSDDSNSKSFGYIRTNKNQWVLQWSIQQNQ